MTGEQVRRQAELRAWRDLAEKLAGNPDIATADVSCPGAPVQIEGTFTDGRHWYFRSRHSHATLGTGATEDEAVGNDVAELYIGPNSAASWLTPDEAEEVFARLLGIATEGEQR